MDVLPPLFDAAEIAFNVPTVESRSFLATLLGGSQPALRDHMFFNRRAVADSTVKKHRRCP